MKKLSLILAVLLLASCSGMHTTSGPNSAAGSGGASGSTASDQDLYGGGAK